MIPRLFLASITVTALSCEAFVAPGQLISTFRLHEHVSGTFFVVNSNGLVSCSCSVKINSMNQPPYFYNERK